MQVGHTGQRIRLVRQHAREVEEVFAVTSHLDHRMQPRTTGNTGYIKDFRIAFERIRGRPLLQFDNDIGGFPGLRMCSSKDNIGSLRGQRKVILDQHLDITEAGINKVPRQDRKTSLPRSLFGRRSTTASAVKHLLQQLLHQRLRRHPTNACSGRPDERHVDFPKAARTQSCGWGHVRGSNGKLRKSVGPQESC